MGVILVSLDRIGFLAEFLFDRKPGDNFQPIGPDLKDIKFSALLVLFDGCGHDR
ncbi:MAG: hypothetical protein AAGG02_01425 [Cyanobacteria bacterium P01_H01_bin.15]